MKDIKFDNLPEAVRVTYNGNAWIDPAIARIVLQQAQQNPLKMEMTAETKPPMQNSETTTSADEDLIDPYTLTERELEVLQLIVEGCSNAVIAERLYITVGTVKTHDANIVATMLVYGIPQLLTHNTGDFARFSELITVLPLQ